MTAAVEVDDLRVSVGGRGILHGLAFRAPAGCVTGLLGPSGCGKSTLIRCIVGTQQISSGVVKVLGREPGVPALRRRVAYVTQAASVYTDLSVWENLRYFAAVYGVSTGEARRALADVALSDRASQLVSSLSGGQRTRVSLACALLANPELLVLDEPTVGLDPVLRRDLWIRFHELTQQGTTLFVSSHVMDEAGQCDQLLLMREGQLVAADSPSGLRARTRADDLEEAFLRLIGQAEPIPELRPDERRPGRAEKGEPTL